MHVKESIHPNLQTYLLYKAMQMILFAQVLRFLLFIFLPSPH